MDFTTEESEDGEDEGLNPQSGTPQIDLDTEVGFITPVTMVCGTYDYSFHGVYKPHLQIWKPQIVWFLNVYDMCIGSGSEWG